jgi:hypothetical protein
MELQCGQYFLTCHLPEWRHLPLLPLLLSFIPQLVYLDDQLPYLIDTARLALKGMDRKPISDLVG